MVPFHLRPSRAVGWWFASAIAASAAAQTPDERFRALDDAVHAALRDQSAVGAARHVDSDAGRLQLLQWLLLARCGADGRAALGGDATSAAGVAWLLDARAALAELLGAGEVDGDRWAEAVRLLAAIVAADPAAKDGLPRRIAIATALTFSTQVAWMADGSPIDPLARYAAYVQWDRDGALVASFRDLSVWELRYVVGSWANDADLVWARANLKPELRARDRIGDGAHMLKYTDKNAHGVSVQNGRAFYDDKPMTLAVMLEYGGVCGAISRFGTSMAQAFGIPAMPVGQPGHCAFLWQQKPHVWAINNDIAGWPGSHRHDGIQLSWGARAFVVPLLQQAQSDADDFVAAELLRACSGLTGDAAREDLLALATARCPQHFAAWRERCAALQQRGAAPAEWTALLRAAQTALAAHPLAYDALLALAEPPLLAGAAPAADSAHVLATARTLAAAAKAGVDARSLAAALDAALERHAARTRATAADRLDVALRAIGEWQARPQEPMHAAWRAALEQIAARGIERAESRALTLTRLQALCSELQAAKQTGDARWLADRMVKACKRAKDGDGEAAAIAFRKTLG